MLGLLSIDKPFLLLLKNLNNLGLLGYVINLILYLCD
jgi:hypothetical protein